MTHQQPSMMGCTAEKPGTLGAVRVACCSWNSRGGSHCTWTRQDKARHDHIKEGTTQVHPSPPSLSPLQSSDGGWRWLV